MRFPRRHDATEADDEVLALDVFAEDPSVLDGVCRQMVDLACIE